MFGDCGGFNNVVCQQAGEVTQPMAKASFFLATSHDLFWPPKG